MAMRFGRQLFAVLALCLTTAAGLAAQQNGTITGRVTTTENTGPLAGASVEIMSGGQRVLTAVVTDADGNFRFANVPAGTYSLVFMSVGHQTTYVRNVRVVAGANTVAGAAMTPRAILLDPVIFGVSKRETSGIAAPGSASVVSEEEIAVRPAPSLADHLRSTPGVDVATSGVQSHNVVARGFNNIFSGALHMLTDHRIAGVPSLRVNLLNFVPSTNEDVERMEIVLGPGAALYGPNTASGVLHVMTKSPLSHVGTTASVAGGEQGILHVSGRTAHRLSERFGFKVSGQYLKASEWEYIDPIEQIERQKYASTTPPFDRTFFRRDLMRAVGIDSAEAQRRIDRIGVRDFDVQRWSGEARADWKVTDQLSTVFTVGTMNMGTGIELTGLGAGQAKDWRYTFYQARANYGRLFAQAYLNTSNAGETFLLRNGAPIVDESRLWVTQLQHGITLGTRQNFTYGLDYQRTDPRTDGTINGIYEDEDQTTEFGGYLQSETALSPKFDLILAGRLDDHSAIPDVIFSPRAALVFKPTESHALRVTYNKAFSTPSSLNQFLDLGSAIPDQNAALLGYSVRVQGTGRDGFRFRPTGAFQMRSPFTPQQAGGPAALVPADAAAYFPAAVQTLVALAAARGQPIPANLAGYLATLRPTGAQISTDYRHATGGTGSLSQLQIPDVAPIRESTTTAFEAGYKGILNDRFRLAADVWMEKRENLVTPLTILTPLLLLNGPQLVGYLTQRFVQDLGMNQATAQATAVSLAGSASQPGLATIPLGVISSADINANGPQLLTSYYNVDDALDVWGIDLAATAFLSDSWSVNGTASFVSEDQFETDRGESVTLNAPKKKASIAVRYDDQLRGFNGEFRVRYNDEFPVRSGVYNGTLCIGGTEVGAEDCVGSFNLLDLTLGYRLPVPGARVQLAIQNLLNEDYRSFPGVPNIGRMALLRLTYDF